MNLSSEAGPQRLHGGVAQPQNSMKESLTDMTLLLTIDHTAQSSRASSKSTSLALLLHLHTNVGAVVVAPHNSGRWDGPSTLRDPAGSWTGTRTRVTRVYPARSWRQPATWKVRPSGRSVGRYFHPHPVHTTLL